MDDDFSILTVEELFKSELEGLQELVTTLDDPERIQKLLIVIQYLKHRLETGEPL